MSTQQTLIGLLAVQTALAAFTWWPRGEATVVSHKLIEGGAASISKLVIQRGADGEPVELVQENGAWSITSAEGYPADPERLTEVLDALGKIELGAPVATQATSHAQLKVDDADFGRKVVVTAGGTEHTLLLGAATSKAVYLRVDGGADVWQVKGLSEFTFKETARSYWPANYISFDEDKASSFTLSRDGWTVSFDKAGDAWTLDGGPEGRAASSEAVGKVVAKAAAIRLGDPVGKDVKPEYGFETGLKVDWATADGDQTVTGSFVVGAEADGKRYVQAQGNPFVVTVPAYALKELLEATPDTLTQVPGAAPAAPVELPPGLMPTP